MSKTTSKLDLTQADKPYYTASAQPTELSLPPHHYLSYTGQGDPNGPTFLEAMGGLYPLAYAIKKLCKAAGNDFTVPKLEGLWWVEGSLPYDQTPRADWHWNLLIRMPGFVSQAHFTQAQQAALAAKGEAAIAQVRFIELHEARCVQLLHTGPYDDEPASLAILHGYIQQHSLQFTGHHHEIYLSDPRRTAPAKLRTILRQPVQ